MGAEVAPDGVAPTDGTVQPWPDGELVLQQIERAVKTPVPVTRLVQYGSVVVGCPLIELPHQRFR